MRKRRRASSAAHSSRSRRLPLGTCAIPRQRPPIGAEHAPEHSCAARLPSRVTQRGNRFTPRRAVAHQLDQPDQGGEDVERLEAGDDDGQPVPRDERLEHAPAGDRGGVAGGEKTLDTRVRHLGDDLHYRRDVLVRRENRKVRRRIREDRRRRRHRRGLEPGGEEDDLARACAAPARPLDRRCRPRSRRRRRPEHRRATAPCPAP